MPKLNYFNSKKSQRKRWSDNCHKAKAMRRMERGPTITPPKLAPWYEWEITLRNKRDGASVTFDLKSLRDAYERIRVMIQNYRPLNGSGKSSFLALLTPLE